MDRNQLITENERAWLQAQIVSAIDWSQAPAEADRFFARKYRGKVEALWQKTGSLETVPLQSIGPAPSFGLEAFLANWTGVNYDDLCQVSVAKGTEAPAVLSDAELRSRLMAQH